MIKATELRIGNMILVGGKEFKVEGITYDGLNPSWGYDGMDYDYEFNNVFAIKIKKELSGIPLTEEWLLRFGFKIINNAAFYKKVAIKEGVHLHWDENQWHMTININRPVKYIHTLQNLYFDLTGEELTLKELV